MIYRLLFILLLLNGCMEDTNMAVVKTEIALDQNQKVNIVTTDLLNFEIIELPSDSPESASKELSIELENPLFGMVNIGDEAVSIYLEKGFNLSLSKIKNEELTFTGRGSEINNYLSEHAIITNEHFEQEPYIYSLSQDGYDKRIDALNSELGQIKSKNLSQKEVELIRKINEVKSLNYKLNHLIFLHKKGNPIPENLIPPISKFEKFYELHEMQYPEYGIYLHYILDVHFYNEKRRSDFENENPNIHLFYKQVDEKLRKLNAEDKLKELLLAKNLAWSFMMTGLNKSTASMLEHFKSEYPNSNSLVSLEKTYNSFDKLQKGNLIPTISCLTLEGLPFSTSDLKGKISYIDVWATWCMPCIKELPFLNNLKERYSEDELNIIALSIDEDKQSWKDFVSKKKVKSAMHLIGKERNTILKELQIAEIPRYLIIDSDGVIVSMDAPKPSSKELTVLLDAVLKNSN